MAIPEKSLRAAYAKQLLGEYLVARLNNKKDKSLSHLPPAPTPKGDRGYEGRICIIGAGAAGLNLAMMLKFVGITDFDILEADDRVGGRVYTYPQPVQDSTGDHNYYDVGAMRIPDIPWMSQILSFIKYMGLGDKLQKYYYTNDDTPSLFWYRNDNVSDDRFKKFMDDIVESFKRNFDNAFSAWMSTNKDNYSTKDFLMFGPTDQGAPVPPFEYKDVALAELYDTSTGLFDQSFTETVIDYADFNAAEEAPWWRIDGGMQLLTDAMKSRLESTEWPVPGSASIAVQTSTPVIAMSADDEAVYVTTAQGTPQKYDMVFNTTAMAPLQHMDLQGLNLPDDVLTGIRTLGYDRATKVAIRFSHPWWSSADPPTVYGGISSTDLPIGKVVYPSWNDGKDSPATLMVSYTWAQDATRMASLVPDYKVVEPTRDDPIVTLCLQNLVKLWAGRPNAPTFEQLYGWYESHHAWAWSHDRWTGGAYALFGPGQFKNVYPQFQLLYCNDRLAFCGEAISAHHAWIAGAFDSSYTTLVTSLRQRGLTEEADRLKASVFGGGKGRDPEEMDTNLLKWAIELKPEPPSAV